MRTTLDIDEPVLAELKRLKEAEPGKSLGRLVSELLQQALVRRGDRAAPSFRWKSQVMAARIDIEDKEAVYRVLDGDRTG